jgi:hypothetical protein
MKNFPKLALPIRYLPGHQAIRGAGVGAGLTPPLVTAVILHYGWRATASLTPLIAAHFGWEMSFFVAALLAMMGALAWLIVDPKRSLLTQQSLGHNPDVYKLNQSEHRQRNK